MIRMFAGRLIDLIERMIDYSGPGALLVKGLVGGIIALPFVAVWVGYTILLNIAVEIGYPGNVVIYIIFCGCIGIASVLDLIVAYIYFREEGSGQYKSALDRALED